LEDFFAPFHLIILLVVFAVFIIPFWQILKKAGFAPALSLLVWVPLVGLIILYYVAFSDWKTVGSRGNTMP
jgi:hypothetical protein